MRQSQRARRKPGRDGNNPPDDRTARFEVKYFVREVGCGEFAGGEDRIGV